ncbi:MAG: sigma-54-dependent Fis family transcriptional regulator [Planctomycetes bacterium]|nr:sigma-54-dependent Fis family transcriptional regulator [Planctomycetota bacterium]
MVLKTRILVVDDDPGVRNLLVEVLGSHDLEVLAAESGEAALSIARDSPPDAAILDLDLPGIQGVELLERLKAGDPGLPVLILTGRGDIATAVRSTKLGAFAYLAKSSDTREIEVVLRRALEQRVLQKEIVSLRGRLHDGCDLYSSMGPSRQVRMIVESVKRVADSGFTVLLQGETGTGKELVARALHVGSLRRTAPFIALDCGSIPEALIESELFGHEPGAFTGASDRRVGHFQLAQGGTLFLDELANLPIALQSRLLRVLQERTLQPLGARRAVQLDVRFVAATNADLREAVSSGRFRQDLYFRLAEYTIQLPPLRERREDIGYLAGRFAEEASIELRRPARTLSESAIEMLERYAWPGNVRELRNVVRQAVLVAEELQISTAHLRYALGLGDALPARTIIPQPAPPLAGRSLRDIAASAVHDAERVAIRAALEATGGNKSEAARRLKTDYKTLYVKLRLYGLR